MKIKKKYLIVIGLVIFGGLFVARRFFIKDTVEEISNYESYLPSDSALLEDDYNSYYKNNQNNINYTKYQITITPNQYEVNNNIRIDKSNSFNYESDIIKFDQDNEVSLNIDVSKSGMYYINLDYYYNGNQLFAPKIGVQINGEYPFYESRQLSVPVTWAPEIKNIENGKYQKIHIYDKDRYENEIQPKSNIVKIWMNSNLYDSSYYYGEPLLFYLNQGINKITIISRTNDLFLGKIKIISPEEVIDYGTYYKKYNDEKEFNDTLIFEAEYYTYKSDPSIKLYSDTNPQSTKYQTDIKRLNAIDAYTWNEAGRSVTWEINVPQDGLYKLCFKYIQYTLVDLPAFRKIEIDGQVPFKELLAYPFHYTTKWKNETLGNENEEYRFYLTKGIHEIKLTSVIDPYRSIIKTLETIMSEITDLALDIKKITGGKSDVYRDWKITDYIPDLPYILNKWADELDLAYRYGNSLNNTDKKASQLINLKYAEINLRKLAEDPNNIPNNLTMLSEGTVSASQYLGDLMLQLTNQSLGLEKFYLYKDNLPDAEANFFVKIIEFIKKFFLSFAINNDINDVDENTIEIWVNRPQANIDLMQKMIDEEFTPNTDIKVNLSLMPNSNKLILANASGIEPDIAMGIANNTPYEFAIRNAVVDFRNFDGYEELVANFPKGVMIPYVYDEGVYGLPETVNFYLTFYRTDLLEKLSLPVPNTWDEVISILPELQRFGMNYYVPLGSGNAYKSFSLTIPYYYQNNAKLYSDDGMSTVIDSQEGLAAMKMMTDLFTIYDLPKQIPNFYNHFRYGTLPIGIGDTSNYLQLLIAAPEIRGNWEVKLFPGVIDDNGVINRYAPVSSTSIMMFKSSKKQEIAFEFIKWWLSTDTQVRYANDIQTMYGKEYMWFSANINALQQLSIDEEHKETILEQLSWAIEAPNVPGGYYLEREISNAWNSIVFNDKNVRSSVDDAVIQINREIKRKMIEFGYVINDKKVRDFIIPNIDNIDYWLKSRKETP